VGQRRRVTFANGTRGRRADWFTDLGRVFKEGRSGNICGEGRGEGQIRRLS